MGSCLLQVLNSAEMKISMNSLTILSYGKPTVLKNNCLTGADLSEELTSLLQWLHFPYSSCVTAASFRFLLGGYKDGC